MLLLAFVAGGARADGWDRLYGHWAGTGTVNGMAAVVEFEFRDTLDGRGRHLSFVNRMTTEEGMDVPCGGALPL